MLSKDFSIRCGYIVYSINDQSAYLEAMYLETPYRGKGLGKHILKEFENKLKKKKIEKIGLFVFTHNLQAYKLYEKMGYLIEISYSKENKSIGHLMKKDIIFNTLE